MVEMRMIQYRDGDDTCGDESRVLEWEIGLPSGDDLTPLSHSLVPPLLALAFSVTSERNRTIQDVNRASQVTLSSLCNNRSNSDNFKTGTAIEEMERVGSSSPGSDPKKSGGGEAVGSMAEEGDSATYNDLTEKTLKRPRLIWTPELHKRFLEVVDHLGIKNAVPKTIMNLMNVDGLTRENVASHLQKYRLYLKRSQKEDPSSSDQLFSSASGTNGDAYSCYVRADANLRTLNGYKRISPP